MGGFVASIGIFLPSFLMLVAVSLSFDRIRTSPMVNRAITRGLCSFVGLLLTVSLRCEYEILFVRRVADVLAPRCALVPWLAIAPVGIDGLKQLAV